MNIPFKDFGGVGEELLFLHANGYPPDCYKPLLSRLAENYRVTAMVQRPLWPNSKPEDVKDWHFLTEDLLRYMDAHHSAPIACVGHSMGGIALLRAALREPERFKAIVLLDPVLLPPFFIVFWHLMRKLKISEKRHPFLKAARERRQHFDDLERLYNGYRRKSVFKYFDDEALRAYVEGIACPLDEGGYQLCYSAEWEVHIYKISIWRDMDIWRGLPELKVPTFIVRGAETDTFWERTAKLVKRKQPNTQIEALEKSTHLLALERPNEISKLIQSFFEEKL
jgi:pimeloyl-ACP methyl ester carboxylesterase